MNTRQHIEQIAREHLKIETLQTQNSDSRDFHEVAVWSLASALDAAYRAGQSELLAAAAALLEANENQVETRAEWRRLRSAVNKARKAS